MYVCMRFLTHVVVQGLFDSLTTKQHRLVIGSTGMAICNTCVGASFCSFE